jgi:hypothetical protein
VALSSLLRPRLGSASNCLGGPGHMDFGGRQPRFKSCLCHFPAGRLWANDLTFLCLLIKV